ncbi:MAG TPA: hypothetical protein GXX46_09515 [Peptococcaceae bacterium]|nr:hypothetical protein [Peptococcaceae bacterium]
MNDEQTVSSNYYKGLGHKIVQVNLPNGKRQGCSLTCLYRFKQLEITILHLTLKVLEKASS